MYGLSVGHFVISNLLKSLVDNCTCKFLLHFMKSLMHSYGTTLSLRRWANKGVYNKVPTKCMSFIHSVDNIGDLGFISAIVTGILGCFFLLLFFFCFFFLFLFLFLFCFFLGGCLLFWVFFFFGVCGGLKKLFHRVEVGVGIHTFRVTHLDANNSCFLKKKKKRTSLETNRAIWGGSISWFFVAWSG